MGGYLAISAHRLGSVDSLRSRKVLVVLGMGRPSEWQRNERRTFPRSMSNNAGVAELVDAKDLKSFVP